MSFLATRFIPILPGVRVVAGHGTVEEIQVVKNVPVALLIEFSAGGGEGGSEKGPEFLVTVKAELPEAHRKVDILDGDVIGIESANRFTRFTGGPEGAKGDFILC